MDTSDRWLADIIGAGVEIVAVELPLGQADSPDAIIAHSAEVQIITGSDPGLMTTGTLQAAGIRGAGVPIVTVLEAARGAGAIEAAISLGAGVAVITCTGDRLMPAARVQVADIPGAGISVIAGQLALAKANPLAADISGGAGGVVVAGRIIERVAAPLSRDTPIISAGVSIITRQLAQALANTQGAGVDRGTWILIITGQAVVVVAATASRLTGIRRAGISVITVEHPCSLTGPVPTPVVQSAGITIIAGAYVGDVDTTEPGIAGIIGAWILIITYSRLASAQPVSTDVSEGAPVVVITESFVARIQTPATGITDVQGAGIGIITGHLNA